MLYIFHVDIGYLITVDINMTTKTVSELQEELERECNISPQDQVLLMSGGEVMQPQATVGSYSTGTTDSNPIFLFNKAFISCQTPPAAIVNYVNADDSLDNRFKESQALPVAFQTLLSRTELASHCCTLSREQLRACERLVHDQHLQQQGWAAVLANLDDIAKCFGAKFLSFEQSYTDYLAEREQFLDVLKSFNAAVHALEKIPVLPALIEPSLSTKSTKEQQPLADEAAAATATGASTTSEKDSTTTATTTATTATTATTTTTTTTSSSSNQAFNLFKWIVSKEAPGTLEHLMESTTRMIEQFDEQLFSFIKTEGRFLLDSANRQDKKEIGGLSERLYQLEKLVTSAKKCVNEQSELSQGFQQNMSRVNNLKDDSVIPDLCMSHKNQLNVMHANYKTLCDYRRRCMKAKEELSASIHRHLKWIAQIENRISDLDNKLLLYNDSMRKLRRQMVVIRQIHIAPEMYVSAITEVVRRRTFSDAFLTWAGSLACQIMSVHSEELQRRRDFQTKFQGHFLASLFPGLEDTPPAFATVAPKSFDTGLPKLTVEDVEVMKQQLPDLASSISMPDLNSITQFFISKSFSASIADVNKEKENDLMAIDDVPKGQEVVRLPLISDRGGFESETDTEEFEKIGQATMDSKQTSYDSTKQQANPQNRLKQLEEDLNSSREEVERLRSLMRELKSVACESLVELRRDLAGLKERTMEERTSATGIAERLTATLGLQSLALREREQELTVDHELELADLKKVLQAREDQIETIKSSLIEKESHANEQERLLVVMRQKFEGEHQEVQKLQAIYGQIEERLAQSRLEKENALECNEVRLIEINTLKSSEEQCQNRIKELEEQLATAEKKYQKIMKEQVDRIQMEHKIELENIRGRFKLMAASTMERSPSDSSLEKIERADVIELVNHETILAQAKQEMEVEKEQAIQQALKDLQMANEIIKKNEMDLQNIKLEKLALLDECERYKSTVERLQETEILIQNLKLDNIKLASEVAENSKNLELRDKLVRDLEMERDDLRRELEDKRMIMSQENIELKEMIKIIGDENKDIVKVSETKKVKLETECDLESSGIMKDMNASVSVVSDASLPHRSDATTSTDQSQQDASTAKHLLREKSLKGINSLLQHGKVTYLSCNRGDVVVVHWDQEHRNYTVLIESDTKYFLNSDCLSDLGLKPCKDGLPSKIIAIAEVVEKEFCKARKSDNRYRVPIETKFYRVRVKPYNRLLKSSGSKSQ